MRGGAALAGLAAGVALAGLAAGQGIGGGGGGPPWEQASLGEVLFSENGVPAMALASFFYVARPVFGALEALRGVGLPSLSA